MSTIVSFHLSDTLELRIIVFFPATLLERQWKTISDDNLGIWCLQIPSCIDTVVWIRGVGVG